ncbi:DNA-binding response regulator [Enemella evansiae]|uniref:response regulator n=1 Tax=Enemella evansiae TaxID=2016499 RepID=UPI000B966D7B|nr:response regulator transcription factor [Enemella evansiae]OYO00691.1 DNA-binding response regulator [Enemella evansiae]
MSERPTILVVDDEPSLVKAMEINLRARGFAVLTAGGAKAALEAVTEQQVDLVLLDLGLPDGDGLEVIAGIRGWSAVPILVLSARHTSDDKVEALDAGADDYVTKPFAMNELLARIRAGLRRGGGGDDAVRAVTAGPIRIDLARTVVTVDGAEVKLTPTEWRILELLARNAGALVAQSQILAEVWGPGYEHETQYLRVYLATLRRKLEPDPSHPAYLITEPGHGYRLLGQPG